MCSFFFAKQRRRFFRSDRALRSGALSTFKPFLSFKDALLPRSDALAPSSFLFLVVWPGAPSSVPAPSSDDKDVFGSSFVLSRFFSFIHRIWARCKRSRWICPFRSSTIDLSLSRNGLHPSSNGLQSTSDGASHLDVRHFTAASSSSFSRPHEQDAKSSLRALDAFLRNIRRMKSNPAGRPLWQRHSFAHFDRSFANRRSGGLLRKVH